MLAANHSTKIQNEQLMKIDRDNSYIRIPSKALCALIDSADEALDSDNNDDEHDALYSIRESLFEIVVNAKREAFLAVHMRDNKANP
jgi:hypothetical protein